MELILCKNYDEMSERGANIIARAMIDRPNCILGLATGSTPVGMYKRLIEMNRARWIDFSGVTTFNLDEYYPISPENSQSYRYFMNENLFNHVNIDKKNTYVPNGNATDAEAECKAYDAMIENSRGIDIQVLGIGINGHIGFNEPDENLITGTHLTALTESTIEANARFFDSKDEVPRHALTMGIGSIMRARKIILLASGKNKHDAVMKLLDGKLTTACPATMLKLHPDVILICDEAAYNG